MFRCFTCYHIYIYSKILASFGTLIHCLSSDVKEVVNKNCILTLLFFMSPDRLYIKHNTQLPLPGSKCLNKTLFHILIIGTCINLCNDLETGFNTVLELIYGKNDRASRLLQINLTVTIMGQCKARMRSYVSLCQRKRNPAFCFPFCAVSRV